MPSPGQVANASWTDIIKVLAQDDLQIGLAGPPGVGKTYNVFEMGKILKKITQKVQAHSELSPAEALGMYVPEKDGFRWEAGPIDICYSKGGLLIIDEIVEASGSVKTFLYGAFDRGPGGTISYVGRQFKQQPGYQAVATMNGYPDQGGLPEALLDRFDAWFIVTEPSEAQYRLLDRDLRAICRDCYASARDPMAGPIITFRMLMGLQKMRRIAAFPQDQAILAACYGNKTLAHSLSEILALSDDDDEEDDDVVASEYLDSSEDEGETDELEIDLESVDWPDEE